MHACTKARSTEEIKRASVTAEMSAVRDAARAWAGSLVGRNGVKCVGTRVRHSAEMHVRSQIRTASLHTRR